MRTLSTPTTLVIPLRGELSETTHDHAEALLADALKRQPRHLVLDLSHITFINSRGLFLLTRCLRIAAERGTLLTLAGLRPEPYMIFELLGAVPLFRFSPSVEDAGRIV